MVEKTPEERVKEKLEKFKQEQEKNAPKDGVVIGKAFSFREMIEEVERKNDEASKEFKENGGMCLNCGKYPGDNNGVNPFHCKRCNEETEVLIRQLSKDPGFVAIGIGKR